jgi:plasmid replication initiation protein
MAKITVIESTGTARDIQIVKSNALIEAKYSLSIGEQRLILVLLWSIGREDPDFQNYYIKVRDFIDMYSLEKSNGTYADLKKAVDTLEERRIEIWEGKSWEKFRWFSYAKYIDGSGVVQMRFDPAMKPYLQALREKFTQYGLSNVIHFKNKYSIRLYEFFKKDEFKANGHKQFKIEFELQDLRERLGLKNDEYPVFADFRRRVLDPAKKEISNHSDINLVQIDYEREGRAISKIIFHVESVKDRKLKADTDDKGKWEQEHTPEIIWRLVEFWISEETAKIWKKRYGIKKIERNLGFTKAKLNEWGIKEKCGFLAKALEGDFGGDWAKEKDKKDEAKKIAKEESILAERKAEEVEKKKDEINKIFESKVSGLSKEEMQELYRRFDIKDSFSDVAKRVTLRAKMSGAGMLNQA